VNRIVESLKLLAGKNEKALALFLTAGYPGLEETVPLVLALERAGADLIEIGMPFSDPIADGPIIQMSSTIALRNGVTLGTVLDIVRRIRASSEIPVALMGYMNPIMRFGTSVFFREAGRAGVDGVILPELPLEESPRVGAEVKASGLSHIHLVTPTSPPERIRAIDAASTGFLYCVSTTGVTGSVAGGASAEYLSRVKSLASLNPVLVGFGIRTPEDAAKYAAATDGVIVGSALLERISKGESKGALCAWVKSLKAALHAGPLPSRS